MTALTEAYIDSLALNASAIKNGNDLVRKNSYTKLNITEDQSLLFGECKGSGKTPYNCSADFQNEGQPVFRCSCPSRQFPCKHILGLLYAYASSKPFETAALPDDIAEKREKAEKREQKREEKQKDAAAGGGKPAPARKVNKAALAKKLQAQLEGTELAEKLIGQLTESGLASCDARVLREFEDQAKQLGNYYITGIQSAVRGLLQTLKEAAKSSEKTNAREGYYSEAIERLSALHILLKRARAYVQGQLESKEQQPVPSALDEQIGHAWQLAELRELGGAEPEAELLQLAFRSYADDARGEYVDEGYWLPLGGTELVATRSYRPFRAAKHMKEEDSCFMVVQTAELFKYPGDWTPRVRWEEMTMREPASADYAVVSAQAERSVPTAIKKVKNELKNPLGIQRPVALLHAAAIGLTEQGYALEDGQGNRLQLADLTEIGQSTLDLLPYLREDQLRDTAVLVMFEDRLDDGRLVAQPLSLCNGKELIRLLY